MPDPITESVYPNYDITFQIATGGLTTQSPAGYVMLSPQTIKEVESMSVSIDGNVEEWNTFDAKGWTRRMLTGKSISISMTAKRSKGDAGNDYIASKMSAVGNSCSTGFEITFPDGSAFLIPCVLNVTSCGGDPNALDTLEFEILSNGKPNFTPATPAN